MGIAYRITYHEHVVKHDIPAISQEWRSKIKYAIDFELRNSTTLTFYTHAKHPHMDAVQTKANFLHTIFT